MDQLNTDNQITIHRPKTHSKEFYDDEVYGSWTDENGRKVVYLKPDTRRRTYSYLEEQYEETQYKWKERMHKADEKREWIRSEENDWN